jgi:hypothetical protein
MKLTKNIGRIDHVVISVAPKSYKACVEKLARTLGLTFQTLCREDENVQVSIDWDAGMEVVAPIREEGFLWERIQTRGDGYMNVVFGVSNFENARARASEAGVETLFCVDGLHGNEPWFDRFSVMKEAILEPIFGAAIVLGEIEPRY